VTIAPGIPIAPGVLDMWVEVGHQDIDSVLLRSLVRIRTVVSRTAEPDLLARLRWLRYESVFQARGQELSMIIVECLCPACL
jgi:hypothetical protein